MLNELVQRIEFHQAEKVDGVWGQRLTIHYNCAGAITIPENLPLPMPDITVNTRKGVYVSCQPRNFSAFRSELFPSLQAEKSQLADLFAQINYTLYWGLFEKCQHAQSAALFPPYFADFP